MTLKSLGAHVVYAVLLAVMLYVVAEDPWAFAWIGLIIWILHRKD